MSQDRTIYEISDNWDVEELRHEIRVARAERDAALKSRDRWKTCAKRATEMVVELARKKEGGEP